jgi:hypothetical protein
MALFVVSTAFGLFAIFNAGPMAVGCATISLLSTFSSQVIERYFFFTASFPA